MVLLQQVALTWPSVVPLQHCAACQRTFLLLLLGTATRRARAVLIALSVFIFLHPQDSAGITEKTDLVAKVREVAAADSAAAAQAPPGYAYDPATGYWFSEEAGEQTAGAEREATCRLAQHQAWAPPGQWLTGSGATLHLLCLLWGTRTVLCSKVSPPCRFHNKIT